MWPVAIVRVTSAPVSSTRPSWVDLAAHHVTVNRLIGACRMPPVTATVRSPSPMLMITVPVRSAASGAAFAAPADIRTAKNAPR